MLTITRDNITGLKPDKSIKVITWKAGELTSVLFGYPNMTKLVCSGNGITSIDILRHFKDLDDLDCSNNKIADITIVIYLKLRFLDISTNKVTCILPVIYNPRMLMFSCLNNPIQHHPNTKRFCENISSCVNTYDASIRPGIYEAIVKMFYTRPWTRIPLEGLSEEAQKILVEYVNDKTVHKSFLLTYEEFLEQAHSRIIHPDILLAFDRVLTSSYQETVEGRIIQLLRVIEGYYSDINL